MLGTIGKGIREVDYQNQDSPILRIYHLCIGLIVLSIVYKDWCESICVKSVKYCYVSYSIRIENRKE